MKDAKDPGTMELPIEASWPTMNNIESALHQLQAEIAKKRETYNQVKAKTEQKRRSARSTPAHISRPAEWID